MLQPGTPPIFVAVSAPPLGEIPATASNAAHWVVENIRPHESAVRGYLEAHFPSIDADDVVQESYLKLFRLRAVQKITSARSYFFSVARNTALTVFRRQQLYSDVPVAELPPAACLDDTCDAAQSTYSRQRLELVVAALDELPARCREVMQLSLLEGLSTAAIAGRLGLAESTVRVQLVRGTQRCAEYIRQRGERI